jgi:hypothetical protein
MSLVTLKRISQIRYNDKVSHNQPNGFSLTGNLRNTSYIGQTSLSKKNKVPNSSRNGGVRGSGGNIVEKEMYMNCCKNDGSIVKTPVKNTRGMLANRFRHIQRPYPYGVVQPDTNIPQNHGQSAYIEKIRITTNCNNNELYYLNQTAQPASRSKIAGCYQPSIFPDKVNNSLCFSKKIES